jgi:hypothetical protein
MSSESERRIVVEVFRNPESGRFEARPIGAYRLGHDDDLLCWSDSPAFTPGQALARLGEAIDVDIVRDGWDMPREDLDPVPARPDARAGDGVREKEPSATEIRDRVLNLLAALKAPASVRASVDAHTWTSNHDRVPCARMLASHLEGADVNAYGLRTGLADRNLRLVPHGLFIFFVWALRSEIVGLD